VRFTFDELMANASTFTQRSAVRDTYRHLDEVDSPTAEQWREGAIEIGWNISMPRVLERATKKRKEKMTITENDLRRALAGVDGIAGLRLGPTPSDLADRILEYLKENPEEFSPLATYRDRTGEFFRRTEDNDGWYEFGSALRILDSVPLRPLKIQP